MNSTPFHADEIEAQARAAVAAPSGSGIRAAMTEQHRRFLAEIPYIFVAVTDTAGWPMASVLTGDAGFAHAPDAVTLRVDARPDRRDPAAALFGAGQEIGILGIDFAARRRQRINGRICHSDARGFTVAVRQSFGNCAQYIQRRALLSPPESAAQAAAETETLAGLDAEARRLVAKADTFFVASRARSDGGENGGADMSHRGGRPGFVRVEGDTLSVPDFSGNRYFNTLGNLLGEPRASLLFIDFAAGDLLQLQGIAEIDWQDAAVRMVEGAERSWRIRVERGWRRRAALPLRWSFVDYSPVTLKTGVWPKETV